MAGPGGAEVGRVHIKVVPDFTQFRKDMLEELKYWESKKVTIKVDADRTGLAGLTKDLNRNAKQASRQMSKELSKGMKAVGKDVKIAPALNMQGRYKRRVQNQLNKMFEQVEISLNFKGGDNQALMRQLEKDFAAVQKKINKLNPDLGPNMDGVFAADARFINDQLNELRKATLKYRKDALNPAGARVASDQVTEQAKKNIDSFAAWNQQLARTEQSLRRIDRAFANTTSADKRQALREIIFGYRDMDAAITNMNRRQAGTDKLFGLEQEIKKVATGVDRIRMRGGLLGGLLGGVGAIAGVKQMLSATVDGIKGVGSAAADAGKKLGDMMPSFGSGINFAGWGVIAAAITMIAAPLAGLLTTAMLTLPGVLALVMAPIGAVVLGFGGIKKAAEDAGLFGDKNGDKKGGGSLGAALTDLQKQVEDVFSSTLTQPFKDFGAVANTWVGPLTTVAQGAADVMKGMLESVTSSDGADKISKTFEAIGSELSKSFAPGIADFTSALINLAHQFTTGGALEGVGTWFKETMADFKEWTSSTDLTTQFGNLGTTLKTVLDTLGSMATEGLAFVGDQSKMQGFLDTLKGVGEALQNIVKISNDVGAAWNTIMPAVNIGQGIVDIMQGDGQNAWRNFKEAFNAGSQADAPAMAADFSKTLTDGMQAGILLGNPLQGLNEASNEELNRLAYSIAQAGTQGVEQLNQAITAGGVETGVAQQIQAKVGAAVTGALQALEPLKQGLQTEINGALAPLGDLAGRLDSTFGGMGEQIRASLSQVPGIVSSSLGSLGGVAALAMVPLSQAVQKGCDAAVLAAVFGAPKILEPFQALGGQMSGLGADMMAGLGQGITANVGVAKAAAETAAAEVLAAAKDAVRSKSPSKDFMDLGKDTQTGLAIGIQNNVDGPISAIRDVMQAIKDVFGSAEGLNLNFYMGQAATSMSSMATSSKEFRSNMVEAGTSPAVSSGLDASTTDLNDIKRQKAELDVRIAELQAQKNAATDKAAKAGLTAEIDQLRIQKERLDLLKEENGLQEDRKTAIQKLSDTIATNIVDMIKMPGEFAKSTANAAMQDIGISGSGAIPTVANWALDAGTNFIFNVNNMDDALQGQQAQQRAQAAGVAGTR